MWCCALAPSCARAASMRLGAPRPAVAFLVFSRERVCPGCVRGLPSELRVVNGWSDPPIGHGAVASLQPHQADRTTRQGSHAPRRRRQRARAGCSGPNGSGQSRSHDARAGKHHRGRLVKAAGNAKRENENPGTRAGVPTPRSPLLTVKRYAHSASWEAAFLSLALQIMRPPQT